MGATAQVLASGPGWSVTDIVCTSGPHDRPFEERHKAMCIAVVTHGSFQYRSNRGAAVLAPGSLLLGNHGACFECGHEHGVGDRCIAFEFKPEHLEAIIAETPGARQATFAVPRLPPLKPLMPLVAAAEAAREDGDDAALEEVGLRLAGAVVAQLADAAPNGPAPSARDERRATEALRRIEADADAPLSLTGLAREAATSPYHFLRVFDQVVGMTPHQFLLRTRLHRAAVRLRVTDAPIATIAFAAGFNDLSTFNRRFRRLMGLSPSGYRTVSRAQRSTK
jgi:AraC-like DNA-binding protein